MLVSGSRGRGSESGSEMGARAGSLLTDPGADREVGLQVEIEVGVYIQMMII